MVKYETIFARTCYLSLKKDVVELKTHHRPKMGKNNYHFIFNTTDKSQLFLLVRNASDKEALDIAKDYYKTTDSSPIKIIDLGNENAKLSPDNVRIPEEYHKIIFGV